MQLPARFKSRKGQLVWVHGAVVVKYGYHLHHSIQSGIVLIHQYLTASGLIKKLVAILFQQQTKATSCKL